MGAEDVYPTPQGFRGVALALRRPDCQKRLWHSTRDSAREWTLGGEKDASSRAVEERPGLLDRSTSAVIVRRANGSGTRAVRVPIRCNQPQPLHEGTKMKIRP